MKTNKCIQYFILNFIFLIFTNSIYCQEWQITDFGYFGHNIDFLNANTGFIGVTIIEDSDEKYKILKTTNKGISFYPIWTSTYNDWNVKGVGFDMISEQIGYVYTEGILYRTTNGGNNWVQRFQIAYEESFFPTIKFANENLGFISYTRYPFVASDSVKQKIYKITNGGNSWTIPFSSTTAYNWTPIIKDISISGTNIIMVGYYHNFQQQGQIRRYTLTSTNAGEGFGPEYDGGSYGTQFSNIQYLPGSSTLFRIIGSEDHGVTDPNTGTYCYDNFGIGNKYKISNGTENIAGLSFVDANKGYAYVDNKLYITTNSGVNWSAVYTFEQNSLPTNRNALIAFNDIVYAVDQVGNLVTHKLSTNLNSYFDNQSTPSYINFDGTNYSSPSTQYLRGGNSIVYSSLTYIIDPNQSTEKIFYKWSNGKMNYTDNNYYFDMSGTTIANYYKSRSLSTTLNAINNSGQVKSWKDTAGAINRIYESIGGIFFSKSYDNGINFKREEVVNFSASSLDGNNNTNPSIFEARDNSWSNSNPVTHWDRNKNMVACWERFNSTSGETEIKLSARDYEINSDTTFKWNRWTEGSEDRFTHFTSPTSFRSFPKIFAVSMGFTNLGYPHDNYFLIVPHLRPASNGNKIEVSCRFNYIHADFQIDSGDISDLSVINYPNSYLSVPLHFVYRKGIQIFYYKAQFNADGTMAITKTLEEGPIDVSSGDGGFSSRLTPDISLMNNVPVITYAASYDAWRTIEYEDQTTGSIRVYRHPIVKVQKTPTGWSQFVIYNSGNTQSNPDIEGSKSTSSYILNYSIGNSTFKKIANVNGYPGSMCQPNIFSGTDSRLINNSYTGSFGSNLSLLTLSPQSSLYKLDKQNFVITNITAQDSYDIDNLDGVVDLDTVSYSFKVGPIFTQSSFEYYYEVDGVGVLGPSLEEQVIGGIEFNENLRSYPFLLNETQALLIGSNASYVKDNNHYSISEIPYTVNLYNKTTGLLHRTLFQDTIKDKDSVETESLRGFYITDIPNGADSFYVKLEVDNEFDNADYFINPIYEDENEEQDNMNEKKMAVIFENTTPQIHDNNIPVKYDLLQNYPNPFNPTTNLEYRISKLGFVSLKVYDILGKEIKTLVNEIKPAGTYSVVFDGSNLASGVYFYRIEAGEFRDIRRMVLIK